jgi:hypothetical protein
MVAGAVTAALLGAGFGLVLRSLRSEPEEEHPAPAALDDAMATARRSLEAGRFHAALRLLNEAVAQRERWPGSLTPLQSRQLTQLQRQADLLSRLSPLSLQEVLTRASQVRDEGEWAEQFKDHRGRTVIFDDSVSRDLAGRPILATYEVTVGDGDARKKETARLALEDLTLFNHLPLDRAQRLLFGARLARCGREDGGTWVVRFEPDSAVLLTDPEAAVVCADPLEPDLRETLRRQERWLEDLAPQKPARP